MSKEKEEIENPKAFPSNGERLMGDSEGMTLRDYFAAKSINGIILHEGGKAGMWDALAKDAYTIADAMLKERIK